MKLKPESTVTDEVAERRALAYLTHHPKPANAVADAIWPDHSMKPQGAGGAASRVLKRLEEQGKVKWKSDGHTWGWVKV